MMEIEDERSDFDPSRVFEVGGDFLGLDGFCDDLCIDIDAFYDILEEKPDSIKIEQEEQTVTDANPVGIQRQSGIEDFNEYSLFEVKQTFSNANVPDNTARLFGETFNNGLKFEPASWNQSPVGTEAAIPKELFELDRDSYRVGISQYEKPSCIITSAFHEVNNSCVIDSGNHQTFKTMDDSEDASGNMFSNTYSFAERNDYDSEYINSFESKPARFTELSSDANVSLSVATSTMSAVSHGSDVIDLTRPYSALICSLNTDLTQMDDSSGGFFCGNFQLPFSLSNGGEINSAFKHQVSSGESNAALSVKEDRNEFPFGISPSIICPDFFISTNPEREDLRSVSDRTYHQYEDIEDSSANSLTSALSEHMDFSSSGEHYPSSCQVTSTEIQLGFIREEFNRNLSNSKVSTESIQSHFSDCQYIDDDPDICILEDISKPAPSIQASLILKRTGNLQPAMVGCQDNFPRAGGPKFRANDERLLRVALQDLSQPRSEATPPDGLLAVPLLRHQRIALSWMVKQETSGQYCCGGILADDQGLGKTVSTIALILKERPPSDRAHPPDVKKAKLETFNLDDDDDDDGAVNIAAIKQESDSCHVDLNGSSGGTGSWVEVKGKPAAGTLIVCPTSVLRQWAEELHNKVTREANLTVLVYHGSNRTKDPSDLVKYDVVLTTYSIVSMEVPRKPSVNEYADEKRRSDADDPSLTVTSSNMKRKKPLNCVKKRAKHNKSMNAASLDSDSGPLAQLAWFRIVLDEAQSIKNHRTQAAKACWGLRAKRRWCLSGTPIQNAIDDLYSYFRFLRCDQYTVYNDFCTKIKNVISKNPQKGYSRLQTILKFVMLRRTKGTLLDGQPIINLPPKCIELKKVEFTDEERYFYTRLEIESSAQFKEYEAAGTVKQNYVNILLMLLRLRQACDHPLLVNGFGSNSSSVSTVQVAQNLPQEAQTSLLGCLQASLALCGICNDSPEDAVVAVCGHVFCNQCIHEHLISDDRDCPSSDCKARLSLSKIFSKSILESIKSEPLVENISPDFTDPEVCKMPVPCSSGIPLQSSKIRAAIEALQSLGKQEGSTSGNSCNEISLDGNHAQNGSVTGKSLSDPVKVTQEKAIVFSQWTRMLDIFEVELKNSSIQYRRLDGTMSVTARDKAVKDFNTLHEVSVIIMSLKAASLGLNMVAACRVILLDLWWNPTTEDQAVDRAHRIGQTRPVTVLRLTVKDTVEDRILALQQKKREMVAHAFGEDESGGQQTRLTVEDLQFLFNG